MIKKIGIDIVQNKRIRKKIDNLPFLMRILSIEEKQNFDQITSMKRKVEYCAGRFASKEALFKALPQNLGPINYSDITVLNDENGSPYLIFDEIKEKIHLSISHEAEYTVAIIIIEE